ncbi:hypothetical protein EP47_09200 [Legionella norrlandica]|uniref:Uncharacterized protein n=1 Tax=Legionella norrlandica TaxID=1498499 RepID=A0A0A2T791_9GAMM|nr:hypothetical protein [Legionella norrlandica]KGP63298.1 hypothetical protein EP47_09200 [Legionella norrlandica]
MNNLKILLLKIASLPPSDQRWILNQLTPSEKERFNKINGSFLLRKAQQFRKISLSQLPHEAKTAQLPKLCEKLKRQDPLYIAIILEQGQFTWAKPFLTSIGNSEEIKRLMNTVAPSLKPAAKLCVFKQWQSQLDFHDQLEIRNG